MPRYHERLSQMVYAHTRCCTICAAHVTYIIDPAHAARKHDAEPRKHRNRSPMITHKFKSLLPIFVRPARALDKYMKMCPPVGGEPTTVPTSTKRDHQRRMPILSSRHTRRISSILSIPVLLLFATNQALAYGGQQQRAEPLLCTIRPLGPGLDDTDQVRLSCPSHYDSHTSFLGYTMKNTHAHIRTLKK